MNNNTQINPFVNENGEINYTSLVGYCLFAVSELMPFIKKKKEHNGLIHTLVCLLKGSKCMVDNALRIVEKDEVVIEIPEIKT